MFAVLSLLLLSPAFQLSASAAPPPIQRPMGFIEERAEGDNPWTVDYSAAYDTASCELIQNMMDTLIVFNGEHADQYLPSIATNWTNTSLGSGIDSGLPVAGLTFENPQYQPGPNATYYYRYDFKIRSGVTFQPPYNYSLTPADVAYSFQRTMIMDVLAGPEWMLQEPLLDNSAGDDALYGGIADLSNVTQVQELGAIIENAVQFNSTDAWFNIMFPFAYNPFMQILCQSWASIESKQWIINQVIGSGIHDWNGDWSSTTGWVAYHSPTEDRMPLDQPTPLMYGSGPFVVNTVDYNQDFWAASRNAGYWRGWPADYRSGRHETSRIR